jgi:predicted nucleic-acid-binding protein
VRITPDTNVLIRAAVPVDAASEDGRQAEQARAALREASLIALTQPALCEFVWVLRSVYGYARSEIGSAVRTLCAGASVVCDREAVEAGLRVLEQGGDFADGVIACTGRSAGGDTFLSFDQQAVRLVRLSGHNAGLVGRTAA